MAAFHLHAPDEPGGLFVDDADLHSLAYFVLARDEEWDRQTRVAEAARRLTAFSESRPDAPFSAASGLKDRPEIQRGLALERLERLAHLLERLGPPELVQDHLKDLEILRLELLKREPDRQVVDAKVHALSILALPVGPEARELVELLSV